MGKPVLKKTVWEKNCFENRFWKKKLFWKIDVGKKKTILEK